MEVDVCIGADKLSCEEPHAVSGLLRLFLKQLPDPVIPFSLYDDFIAASGSHLFTPLKLLNIEACWIL